MLSCILWERQKIPKRHKLKRFGARNHFRAAQFVTVLIIACSIKAMERVVCNQCVGGLGTRNSRYMTLDRWPLTSSEISVLHASHSTLKTSPTVKNLCSGPLRPWNLDPIYVIVAFGSILSCILWERQKNSESHKLKHFGARNQLRAGQFVTVLIIACSINAMGRMVCN